MCHTPVCNPAPDFSHHHQTSSLWLLTPASNHQSTQYISPNRLCRCGFIVSAKCFSQTQMQDKRCYINTILSHLHKQDFSFSPFVTSNPYAAPRKTKTRGDEVLVPGWNLGNPSDDPLQNTEWSRMSGNEAMRLSGASVFLLVTWRSLLAMTGCAIFRQVGSQQN